MVPKIYKHCRFGLLFPWPSDTVSSIDSIKQLITFYTYISPLNIMLSSFPNGLVFFQSLYTTMQQYQGTDKSSVCIDPFKKSRQFVLFLTQIGHIYRVVPFIVYIFWKHFNQLIFFTIFGQKYLAYFENLSNNPHGFFYFRVFCFI